MDAFTGLHIPSLSLVTLLVACALPLVYFFLHHKFWYDAKKIQRGEILLRLFAGLVFAFVLYHLTQEYALFVLDDWLLALAHVLIALLPFLLVHHGSAVLAQAQYLAERDPQTQANLQRKSEEKLSYQPAPVNTAVEHIEWNQIVLSDHLRGELQTVIALLKNPEEARRYAIETPKGILFSGPPGTGKTTIAKVIASTAGLNFFALKLDEVVSKWVGESEKNLSALFHAAQAHAPAIIFVDEIDAIGRSRGSGQQNGSEMLLNHMLQLIDGVVRTHGLYIIGATNRPDMVDPALRRAGRLEKVIEIPLPDAHQRMQLFHLYLSRLHIEGNLDLSVLARITEGKSGADIKAICNQAGMNAFRRESLSGEKRSYVVNMNDLRGALEEFLAK